MGITERSLWTMIHGMGFGALYLLACSGAIVELWRQYGPEDASQTAVSARLLQGYLTLMAILAWLAVFTGAYVIYPWYRSVPPSGTTNLTNFPQRLLMSNPSTTALHTIGMEWKEHVAWIAPIAITMAAAVAFQYGAQLRRHPQLRNTVLSFVAVSFVAAGIAGFFGAMLDKSAPVRGGNAIQILREQ